MFEHKLVAILNKDIEAGVVKNALAHMCIGLGADVGKELLRLDTYTDANGNAYPDISQIPFIILRAKGNEIRKTVRAAREKSLKCSVFLDTMRGGTYREQLTRTKETPEENLGYIGCALFGPWADLTEMTRKFSLWQ
jgi:hypothetical protein